MTPEAFIARWKDNALTERAGAQAHFDDLCDLLGVAKPRDPEHYCFERGAKNRVVGTAGPMSGSAAVSGGRTRNRGAISKPHSSSSPTTR